IVLPGSNGKEPKVVYEGERKALEQSSYNSTTQTFTLKGSGGSHTLKVTYQIIFYLFISILQLLHVYCIRLHRGVVGLACIAILQF
ncbi:hypothetical protein F5882DRAFT_329853, partial [Hyaloscypha sp. PMI_1271]